MLGAKVWDMADKTFICALCYCACIFSNQARLSRPNQAGSNLPKSSVVRTAYTGLGSGGLCEFVNGMPALSVTPNKQCSTF